MTSNKISALQGQLDPACVHQMAFDMVAIPSPTGDTRRVTEFYAGQLRALGLEVHWDDSLPESPSVVAYLNGGRPGPTLELAGHLDAIPVAHDPAEIRDGMLYGRGAADMKGSMGGLLEVARVLAPLREQLAGRLMICAYGYHEAPLGRGQNLLPLLARGIVGDAVINVEGPDEAVAVVGKGMSIFEITIARAGEPVHEVQAPKGLPHPLLIGLDVATALRQWNEELAQGEPIPYLGPESVFLGQFESGDFYNRVPNRCLLVGTRRYAPAVRFPQVEAEFQARLDGVRQQCAPATIDLNLMKIKDGFCVSEDEPVVRLLQQSFQELTGRPLPCGGFTAVGDVSNFVNEGGVPAVYYGCGLERAHATPEYVALSRLERQARVLLSTAARFLGLD